MEFETILKNAKDGYQAAMEHLFGLYKPLLLRTAIVNGRLDEDLYQELCVVFLRCVRLFRIL